MQTLRSSRQANLFSGMKGFQLCCRIGIAALLIFSSTSLLNAQSMLVSDQPNQTMDASALFEVRMNGTPKKGVLIPHMTKLERDGISSPTTGLLVYQTDGVPGIYCNVGLPDHKQWFAIGSGGKSTDVWNDLNTVLGVEALSNINDGNANAALNNTAVGYRALRDNLTGIHNAAVGRDALLSNQSGSFNVAVGSSALLANVSGNDNIAIGGDALRNNK
jgi:hypothetical protein